MIVNIFIKNSWWSMKWWLWSRVGYLPTSWPVTLALFIYEVLVIYVYLFLLYKVVRFFLFRDIVFVKALHSCERVGHSIINVLIGQGYFRLTLIYCGVPKVFIHNIINMLGCDISESKTFREWPFNTGGGSHENLEKVDFWGGVELRRGVDFLPDPEGGGWIFSYLTGKHFW